MSTSARCVILTTRRSSINSVTSTTSAMGLDVLSLNSGVSNRVHDSGSTTSSKRVRERRQRASKPSMRGVSISTRSIASKESKRRRRRPHQHQHESSACGNDADDEEDQQEVGSYHRRWTSKVDEDPLDSGKTEHTSNLTEHSRTIRQGLDDDITCNKVEDDSHSSDNEDVVSLGGKSERSGEQTVETRESRFQSLLNQWKTREKEQKELSQRIAPDTKSKANYLSEDEDHSCFEGVLKHWKKRAGRSTTVESNQPEVVLDDETSEVSSLGDSLRDGMRWGYESDSRFDFGFDARFDTPIPASPRSAKKKKKKSSKKKEESKSPKKEESKSPKLSKKKKNSDSKTKKKKIVKSSDASYATFDPAMNAAEAAMDESVATMDTLDSKKKKKKKSKSKKSDAATDAAAEDGSVATMDESLATMDTMDSKKKKKKSKSKKKIKNKKSSKKSLMSNENSESTATEVPPLSDDEGSKGAYLPGWLSPAAPTSPVKRKSKVDSPKKNDPPTEMPEIPNLL